MTDWIISHSDFLRVAALLSGIAACSVALHHNKPSLHTILWLVGMAMWAASLILPRIVLAQSEKWSELLSRNGWFVPTTVWLNSLATVTVLAGSILFLLQQRKGLEDNNHKEGTAE